jgi:anti-sigma-K factor RskA
MTAENHVTELIPAYVLDCLDQEEAVYVKEHLAACLACQTELHSYQAVADQLPLMVAQVEPPLRVKGALMARIQAAAPDKAAGGLSFWQRISGFTQRLSPAWTMASLVLILILAASNLLLWRQVNQLSTPQPDVMRVVTLNGTGIAPQATALLVISLDGEHGTLVVDNLPDLSDQQQYQLWLIDENGNRVSGGVFSVKKGYGSVWVKSPQPLKSYPAFGVTVEPWGGSPEPTGDRVLGGDL